MSVELLDIYDDNFQYHSSPVGQKPRKDVHKDGDWHKGFHCWIIYRDDNGNGYIVFQRRAASKEDEAFALDITAAGHLVAGETERDGLREVEEELGVRANYEDLIALGMIIEVAAYNGKINREFDAVFLLEYRQPLQDYKLQFEEVDGLTEIKIADAIELFERQVPTITANSIRILEDSGNLVMTGPFRHEISLSDFGGEDRGNYYVKVLVAADLYFRGYKHLYI